MSGVHTTIVTDAHAYTRADVPWTLGEYSSKYGKLIHYLSGGGMSTFGRTIAQERARRQHHRFYALTVIIGVLWLAFYLI